MPKATFVARFVENGCACLAVRVTEAGIGDVEYIGRVRIDEAWQAMTAMEKSNALVAAAKAERDRHFPEAEILPDMSGTVTI